MIGLYTIFQTYEHIISEVEELNSKESIETFNKKWNNNLVLENERLNIYHIWNMLYDMKILNIIPKYTKLNNKKISLDNLIKYDYLSDIYITKFKQFTIIL